MADAPTFGTIGQVSVDVLANLEKFRQGLSQGRAEAGTFRRATQDDLDAVAKAAEDMGARGGAATKGLSRAEEDLVRAITQLDRTVAEATRQVSAFTTQNTRATQQVTVMAKAARQTADEVARATTQMSSHQKQVETMRAAYTAAAVAGANSTAGMQALYSAGAKATPQTEKLAAGLGLTAFQMRMLAIQTPDVVQQLIAGQRPFTILVQQGGQAVQILGMGPRGFGGVLAMLKGLITPVTLGVTALAAITIAAAAAWLETSRTMAAFGDISEGVGRKVGLTGAALEEASKSGAAAADISIAAAEKQAQAYAKTGKIGTETIAGLIAIGRNYARFTGTDMTEATAALGKSFEDPARGAEMLNAQLGFLNDTELRQIQTMADQGNVLGAQRELMIKLTDAVQDQSDKTNGLAMFWHNATTAVSDFMHGVGTALDGVVKAWMDLPEPVRRAIERSVPLVGPALSLGEPRQRGGTARVSGAEIQAALAPPTPAQRNAMSVRAGELARTMLPDAAALDSLKAKQAQLFADMQSGADRGAQHLAQVRQAYRAVSDAIGRVTDATGAYVPQAERDHRIAQLETQAAKTHDAALKGKLQTQITLLRTGAQLVTNEEAQRRATDAGALAQARAAASGDGHAKMLARQAAAMEASIRGAEDLAAAYQLGDAAAMRAEAVRKGETDALRADGDIRAQVSRQIRLAVAEQAAASAKEIGTLEAQTGAQEAANDAVAAGTMTSEQAAKAVQHDAQLRGLAAAAALAEGEAKAKLAAEVKRLGAAYAAADRAAERAKALQDMRASQDQVAAANMQRQVIGANPIVAAQQIATLQAQQKYLGQVGPAVKAAQAAYVDAAVAEARLRVETDNYNKSLQFQSDLLSNLVEATNDFAATLENAFGAAGAALGRLLQVQVQYRKNQEDLARWREAETKAAGDDAIRLAQIEIEYNQKSGQAGQKHYADLIDAASQFFDKNSIAYKVLQGIELAFRFMELQASFAAIMQSNAERAVKVANAQQVAAANMQANAVSGSGSGMMAGMNPTALLASGAVTIGGMIGGPLGGALSGAGTGAMIGSVIPGIGTAIGAAVGGLVGLVGGLFGASAKKRQQEQARLQALAQEAERQANIQRQLEIRLAEAQGNALAALNMRRNDELASMNEANKALAKQVYAAEDAKALEDKRHDLQIQLLLAEGEAAKATLMQRQDDIKALQPELQALQGLIYLRQDEADAIQKQKDLVASFTSLQVQYYQALGNQLQATTIQRDAERDAIAAELRPMLEAVYAAQDYASAIQNVTAAMQAAMQQTDAQIEAAQSSAQTAHQSAQAYRDAAANLRETMRQLRGGDLSTLSPEQKLAEARANLDATFRQALSLDPKALAALPAMVQDMLAASRAYNASNTGYVQDFTRSMAMLQQAGVASDTGAGVMDYQAELLDIQVGLLKDIKTELGKENPSLAVLQQSATLLGQIGTLLQAQTSHLLTINSTLVDQTGVAITGNSIVSAQTGQLVSVNLSSAQLVAAAAQASAAGSAQTILAGAYAVRDAVGNVYQVGLDQSGRITSVRDALGVQTSQLLGGNYYVTDPATGQLVGLTVDQTGRVTGGLGGLAAIQAAVAQAVYQQTGQVIAGNAILNAQTGQLQTIGGATTVGLTVQDAIRNLTAVDAQYSAAQLQALAAQSSAQQGGFGAMLQGITTMVSELNDIRSILGNRQTSAPPPPPAPPPIPAPSQWEQVKAAIIGGDATAIQHFLDINPDVVERYQHPTGNANEFNPIPNETMVQFGQRFALVSLARGEAGPNNVGRNLFGDGAMFEPGAVLTRATAFAMGVAGERAPGEALLPLVRGPAGLGVQAVGPGSDRRLLAAIEELRDEIRTATRQRGAIGMEMLKGQAETNTKLDKVGRTFTRAQ